MLQEGKKGRPNRAAPTLGPSLTPRARPGRAWLGHVGQGTRATHQRSESTCRTGRIRGDQTVRAELLAEPHPTPDARGLQPAVSRPAGRGRRMGPGLSGGPRAGSWRRGSDRFSKSEELLWERTGAWLGKVGVPSDRERCPGQYRAALSAQGTGTGPLSPDPRETRSRAVVAGGQVLRAMCLQVLHGGPGHAVPVRLLPGDQGPPGGGDHAVSQRDGLPAHLHPRGRVQLWPILRLLGPGSRGQHPHLPDLWVHRCLTHSAPPSHARPTWSQNTQHPTPETAGAHAHLP